MHGRRQNTSAMPPAALRWAPDGFSLEIVSDPGEQVANVMGVASIAGLGLVACGALLDAELIAATGLAGVLPWAVRLLFGLGAALAGSLLMLFLVPRERHRVAIQGFVLQLGDTRVAAEDLCSCTVVECGLELTTRLGRRVRLATPRLGVPERVWLRDRILELRRRWLARGGDVPEDLGVLRRRPTYEP